MRIGSLAMLAAVDTTDKGLKRLMCRALVGDVDDLRPEFVGKLDLHGDDACEAVDLRDECSVRHTVGAIDGMDLLMCYADVEAQTRLQETFLSDLIWALRSHHVTSVDFDSAGT
jgi:hypothetical protein